MLSASHEIAALLPQGFYSNTALDTLLALHVAEDDARYLVINELDVPGVTSQIVIERWVAALAAEGLIDRQGVLLALSEKGYALTIALIESIYAAQRRLD